jgi:hypothetical protein
MLLVALIVTPPILAITYAIAEHLGWMDRLTGRKAASDGLKRMRAATGFPQAWIFDDEEDRREFSALEARISRKTQVEKIKKVLAEGARPSCILIGGEPIPLAGVSPEWPLEYRRVYLPEHSVMYMFGVTRAGGPGKAERVCTIAELEKWLAEEKDSRRYKVGALAIGLISLVFLLLRFGAAG